MVGLVSPNAARRVFTARPRAEGLLIASRNDGAREPRRPSFFIRDKVCFVNYMDNHHEDGRLALWCACPSGMRDGLVKAQPDQYFVPPYVGFRGWIGVRLDRHADWDDIERVIRDAYLAVAPKKLAAVLEAR